MSIVFLYLFSKLDTVLRKDTQKYLGQGINLFLRQQNMSYLGGPIKDKIVQLCYIQACGCKKNKIE